MAEAAHRAHPTPGQYWLIALFLGAVTALKFFTVVGFFMHLRYDKKLYRTLFLFGVIGVFPLFIVVLLSLNAL